MGDLLIYETDDSTAAELPYADSGVRAGFPSPAQDYTDESIALNRDIIHHKESTFYARAVGDSLRDANVIEGDILVIDKSLEPQDGDMAVCFLNGEFTLKFIEKRTNSLRLIPANPKYEPINIDSEDDFRIWGIVTYVIHKVERRKW